MADRAKYKAIFTDIWLLFSEYHGRKLTQGDWDEVSDKAHQLKEKYNDNEFCNEQLKLIVWELDQERSDGIKKL